jgi:protein TonB
MDSKNILTADLLDLVFDNRNKDYGAYELRRYYNRRIGKALIITGAFVGITFTSIALSNKLRPNEKRTPDKITAVVIQTLTEEKKPDPIIPQEAPRPQPAAQPVRSEIFTTLVVSPDNDVPNPPPDQTTLADARISNVQSDGVADSGTPTESPLNDGTGIIQQPETSEPSGPFERVEVEAKFSGNWEKFLLRYLNGNVPVDNGAAPGRYTVMVQFVVDVDGSVSDIRPMSSVGFGMEQEAMRVLRKATKWEPAFQNGRQVKAYRKQPITFVVSEE